MPVLETIGGNSVIASSSRGLRARGSERTSEHVPYEMGGSDREAIPDGLASVPAVTAGSAQYGHPLATYQPQRPFECLA